MRLNDWDIKSLVKKWPTMTFEFLNKEMLNSTGNFVLNFSLNHFRPRCEVLKSLIKRQGEASDWPVR